MSALGGNLFLDSPGFWWLQAFLGLWPCLRLFLVALVDQMVKNPPAMQEMQVWSLGREDPLEKEMATLSTLAWEIPRTEEPGGLQSTGSQRVRPVRMTNTFTVLVPELGPTLCDPIDCGPPGSCVHGILQARMLEWVATSSFRGSSRPRDQTHIFCIGRLILYH